MWRVFLIVMLLFPTPVHAEGSLVIRNERVLRGEHQGLESIRLEEGGALILEEGSVLSFLPGASITGSGRLEIRGTTESPVILKGTSWQGIDVQGEVSLSHVHILGAQGYFSFAGGKTILRSILIDDVPDSRLFFWPKDGSGVAIESVTIRWHTVSAPSARTGVYIRGPVGEVVIRNLIFPRFVELPRLPLVEVTNGYVGFQIIGAKTLDGCFMGNPEMASHVYVRYRLHSSCSPKEPSLLFLPGYGASVHFAHLTNPLPEGPNREGWGLVPFFTASYRSFLQDAEQRGIRSSTAFYDWRLRPYDAVEQYLIPAIDALKKRDNVPSVFLVAHSYGGLLARAYVQSALYRGDVAGVVLMGTPNQGSLKAYAPWQAAEFPDDWQILSHLTRLYSYQRPDVRNQLQALRAFIPSGAALQPTGGVLYRSNSTAPDSLYYHPNSFLTDLSFGKSLIRQVPLAFTVTSGSHATTAALNVGARRPRALYWMDGELREIASTNLGDGTVTSLSSSLPLVSNVVVDGSHMQLPENAASLVLDRLYPLAKTSVPPILKGASRETRRILWFAFDCPITVEITSPSGIVRRSTQLETEGIYANDVAIWMLMESEPGTYTIAIEALDDTPVRWWQGLESIHHYSMKKGEKRHVLYQVGKTYTPAPKTVATRVDSDPLEPSGTSSLITLQVELPWQQLTFPTVVFSMQEPYGQVVLAQFPIHKKEAGSSPARLKLLAFSPLILLIRKKAQSESHSHRPP